MGDPGRLPKVVYIAGSVRSGSTVLDQLLGEIDGWFSCGEINLLWYDQQCGCGTRVLACEFWQPLLKEVLARHPGLDPAALIDLKEKKLGASPATLAAIAWEGKRTGPTALRSYASLLVDLYATAGRAAGAGVLIDSSKTAADAYLIATLTDIELYVVHIVRDPRGVAYSRSKSKVKNYEPLHYFGRVSPSKSTLQWLRRNAVIEALLPRRLQGRYLRIGYEDFVEHPEPIARSICSLVGEPEAALPFVSEHVVRVRPNHSVSGNPIRFASGEIRIQSDEEWMSRMEPRARIVATLAAAPLMRHYGYRVRKARPGRAQGDEKNLVAHFWDARAGRYDAAYAEPGPNGDLLRGRLQAALDLVGDGPGSALDAGMGGGRAVAELDRRGWTVSGIDVSAQMVAMGASRLPAAADRLQQASIESIPFGDESFDAVLATGVLEYVNFRPDAVGELARVLRPGGLAIVSIPNRWSPRVLWHRIVIYPLAGIAKRLLGVHSVTRIPRRRPPSRDGFRQTLQQAGLQVELESSVLVSERFEATRLGRRLFADQYLFAGRKAPSDGGSES